MKAIDIVTEIKSKPRNKINGEAIRIFRKSKGFSLRKTAEALGVSPTYMSRIENGHVDFVGSEFATKAKLFVNGEIRPEKRVYRRKG